MKNYIGFGLALVCLILGAFLSWRGIKTNQKGFDTTNWLPVQGTIVTSHVVTRTRPRGKQQTDLIYHADVSYRYTINGKEYSSALIQFGLADRTFVEEARALVKQFPYGKKTDVYYNPAQPSQAVLIRGKSSQVWNEIVFGAFFLLAGVAFIVKAIR